LKKLTHIFLLFVSSIAFGQAPDPRDAKEFFNNKNYLMAIPKYERLVQVEPDNIDYNSKLGLCYLFTKVDKTKAIPFLEKANNNPKKSGEIPHYLGVAYTMNFEFDKAKTVFEEYKIKPGKYADEVDLRIQKCDYAKGLMKKPIDVSFENLGPTINSQFSDYYPFVTKDETYIVFTSRRKEGKGRKEFDGYYPADIWITKYNGSKYTEASSAGPINSMFDERVVGLSDDGEQMMVYLDNLNEFGNIYTCTKKSAMEYGRKRNLEPVNSKHLENSASIAGDNSVMFFSSNRPGGFGGQDIWMIRHLPTGGWAAPQNLGPTINTPFDEDFPTISEDRRTLYFASEGHMGMGGFDLFKSIWNPIRNSWTEAVNLGYPINGPDDDMTISVAADQKRAYISAIRKDGLGELDIYRVTFNSVEVNPAFFYYTITSEVGENQESNSDVELVIFKDDEIFGEYRPNPKTGKFTVLLDPGNYTIEVLKDGYTPYSEDIDVSEFQNRKGMVEKSVKLLPE